MITTLNSNWFLADAIAHLGRQMHSASIDQQFALTDAANILSERIDDMNVRLNAAECFVEM